MHMAQLMPLPLTVSCFSKIQIGFTFLAPAHPGRPGKRAVKRVCVCYMYETLFVGNMWRASVGADVTQSTAPVTVGAAGCHCHITRTSQAQLLHPSSNFTHACCIHTHVNVNQMEYSSLQLTSSLRELTCHMGTQCCLPPRRTDIPTFTPTTAGTRFCDHRGMQDLTS